MDTSDTDNILQAFEFSDNQRSMGYSRGKYQNIFDHTKEEKSNIVTYPRDMRRIHIDGICLALEETRLPVLRI